MTRTALALALAASLVCGATPARAFDVRRQISRYDLRDFGTREGLPQPTVTALAQTPDGYLWIGTHGGLARFDGRSFKVFRSEDTPALRIHEISSLLVDRAGDLWISTAGGAGILRYRDGVFQTFEAQLGRFKGIGSSYLAHDGHLWFGSYWGLAEVANGQFVDRSRLGGVDILDVVSMAEDGDGGLWIGSLRGLYNFSGGKTRLITEIQGHAIVPVPALVTDGEGGVWIGAGGGGLFRLRNGVLRVVVAPGDGVGPIRRLIVDRNHNLWAATERGLARLEGDRLVEAAPASSLGREPSETLFEDAEGDLWLGTRVLGLIRITDGAFQTLDETEFGNRPIDSVFGASDGSTWIVDEGGEIFRRSGGVVTPQTWLRGKCGRRLWAFAEDAAGRIWAGGEYGAGPVLCRIDPVHHIVRGYGVDTGLPDFAVRSLMFLPDGTLWIGTVHGLFHLDDLDKGRILPLVPDHDFDVLATHRGRDGVLWAGVGGAQGGLHRFSQDGQHQRIVDGLSNAMVRSIHEDSQGTLWLGTLSGFSRYRNGKVTGWKHDVGFINDPVFAAVPSGDDIWLCSSLGIYRVTGPALDAFDKTGGPLVHMRYSMHDGLATETCGGTTGAVALTDHGHRLWFVNGKTLAFLDPADLQPERAVVRPLVETVLYDGQPVPRAALGHLPPGQGDLEIAYTAPLFVQAEKLRFRYRLDPFDRDWVDASERRLAIYTHVPPGRYQFRIEAGVRGPASPVASAAPLRITIAPFFYQTLWFQILAALALLGAVVGMMVLVNRRKVQRIEQQHTMVLTERGRIARDLHDTLAQGFTGISLQLEAATGWMEVNPERARGNIDKARALVRSSLVDARRAVWDLRPAENEGDDLVGVLSGIARSLSADLAVRVQVNGRPRHLPPEYETTLVRIAQEAMTNALRHAQANNVVLDISFLPGGVHIKVTDDGRGFHPEAAQGAGGHFGLEGIRSRARTIAAELTIASRPGSGTEVDVWAPMPETQGKTS